MPPDLDRPPPVRLPDPVQWEGRHGLKPYDLDSRGIEDYVAQAARNERDDWSTLEAAEVHDIQAEMDVLCGHAGMVKGIGMDDALIFFDASRRVFVAYPKRTRTPENRPQ